MSQVQAVKGSLSHGAHACVGIDPRAHACVGIDPI